MQQLVSLMLEQGLEMGFGNPQMEGLIGQRFGEVLMVQMMVVVYST